MFSIKMKSILRKFIINEGCIKKSKFCLIFFITFMLLFSLVGMYTILGSYLASEKFEFTEQQIFYVRALGLIGMLTTVFAGKIINKLGLLYSAALCFGACRRCDLCDGNGFFLDLHYYLQSPFCRWCRH